jgi:copper chaperone CopZ
VLNSCNSCKRKIAMLHVLIALLALVPSGGAQESAAKSTKATYLVTGLHCPPCTKTVEKSLSKIKGVKSISVHWDTKNATIEFDESVIPAQTLAQKLASTPHMMGGDMKYEGWLALKVPTVKDEASGKAVKDALAKVDGISQVALYPDQKSIGIQFSVKGKMTTQEIIELLAKAGIEASN